MIKKEFVKNVVISASFGCWLPFVFDVYLYFGDLICLLVDINCVDSKIRSNERRSV
jgi:hypothetical protein